MELELRVLCDADYAGDIDSRQSRNELKLVKIDTRNNPADILTTLEKVRLCATSYGLH